MKLKNKIKKRALITGINGMDGSHLADFLLAKDYEVFGLERRCSVLNRTNTAHLEDQITFIKKLMENNLLTIRAAENVVRILPPLNVKKTEIDQALKTINKVCLEMS